MKAFPNIRIKQTEPPGTYERIHHPGMDLRDYFAAHVTDDFDELDTNLQELIVGSRAPEKVRVYKRESDLPFDNDRYAYNMDYALWLADGRAKWRMIQAGAMMEQRK